jgi:hypothetical protein
MGNGKTSGAPEEKPDEFLGLYFGGYELSTTIGLNRRRDSLQK